MNRLQRSDLLRKIRSLAWIFFLVSLPVTSFPYLPPAIGGGALVRPLALYPLTVLLVMVTFPRLWNQRLPRTFLSLLPFVIIALVSSLISLLRGIEPAIDVTVLDRALRGLFTLALGAAFYLTVSLAPRTLEDLKSSLRWLYAGFGVALLWGSLQAIYVVHFTKAWYRLMNDLQQYVSTRRLIQTRISGMTYEPNWFAEQITCLLLPWLMASVLTGFSVFKWRRGWLTIELLLLAWSIVLLPLTFSRAGVMNLIVMALLSVFVFRIFPGRSLNSQSGAWRRNFKLILRRLSEATIAMVLIGGVIFTAGLKNEFFGRIWGYWIEKDKPTLSGYVKYLGFGARISYGDAAYQTFEEYPILGVGLGNYAFYFEEMLPDRPLALTPEVLRIVTPEDGRDRLITAKNFFLRLLAETGVIGTAAFVVFLLAILGNALYLWLVPDREIKFWGIAGMLGIIAFLLSSLSFDSFSLPNMWIMFGLITAAARYYLRLGKQTQEYSSEETKIFQETGGDH
jgi:O-antigen ligase